MAIDVSFSKVTPLGYSFSKVLIVATMKFELIELGFTDVVKFYRINFKM